MVVNLLLSSDVMVVIHCGCIVVEVMKQVVQFLDASVWLDVSIDYLLLFSIYQV